MLNTIFIAIGLAMDAFAVSISSGIALKKPTLSYYLIFGTVFGFFQFIMPFFGFYGSKIFSNHFANYTNIISFVLLFAIGAKMIFEALSDNDDKNSEIITLWKMVGLGIATSIDALAVGIIFGINNSPILINSIIIGIVAFCFSFVGVYLGKKIGNFIGNKAEVFGGTILILLAINFLF